MIRIRFDLGVRFAPIQVKRHFLDLNLPLTFIRPPFQRELPQQLLRQLLPLPPDQ